MITPLSSKALKNLSVDNLRVLIVYYSEKINLNDLKLVNSFRTLGLNTDVLFTHNTDKYKPTFFERITHKIGYPYDRYNINTRLINWVENHNINVIFVIKGIMLFPKTLKLLNAKNIKLVSWSNDDMFAKHSRSKYYDKGLKYYDLVVTQKSYNCNPCELPSLGARRILFQNKAYDKFLHYPCTKDESYLSHDVVFIGTGEKERLDSLNYLAENGITVNIYGWGNKLKSNNPNLLFHNKHLYGEEFRCAITNSKICLNFLRKVNRDLQTSRSVEIPACGGFMLAERTTEHLNLFKEGLEAEYFESDEELLFKVQKYLSNESIRRQIALNALKKCEGGGFSFEDRIREIFDNLHLS